MSQAQQFCLFILVFITFEDLGLSYPFEDFSILLGMKDVGLNNQRTCSFGGAELRNVVLFMRMI